MLMKQLPDQTGVLKCLSVLSKNKRYKKCSQLRQSVLNEFKATMTSDQLILFKRYEETTSELRDCIKQITVGKMEQEIERYSQLI